ncbi:MAG: HEAT repeat domain-containing protein [Planctomycetes bacterium]|nr:HEAT repeat domain-containing protein [Planctomycetota bacterium]
MNRAAALLVLVAAGAAVAALAPAAAAGSRLAPQSDEFLGAVEAALTDPRAPPAQLQWAGRAVAGLPAERAIPMLDKALAHGDWPARRQAAESLAFVTHPRRVELLRGLARDASWAVRGAALATLRELGGEVAFEAALDALADPVWSVRWHAVRALAAFASRPSPLPDDQDRRRVRALLDAADDADPHVRAEARRVLLLRPEPDALACYLDLFDRRNPERPEVQQQAHDAARALLALGGEEVRAALRARLRQPELGIRILAAALLELSGEHLSPDLHPTLVDDILAAWSGEAGVERTAAEDLAHRLGAPAALAALPRLEPGAGDGALDEIMDWIVDCLGAADPPARRALDALAHRIPSGELPAPMCRALARALGRLGKHAPHAPLTAAYERERTAARRRIQQEAVDTGAQLRTSLFATLSATLPFPGWEELVRAALEDPAMPVRRLAALSWVCCAGPESPYPELGRRLANHPSDHFGRDFLAQLARRGGDAAFEFLMALARGAYSDRAMLRIAALNALTSVTWPQASRDRLVAWLREQLALERDPGGRIRVIMLLANLDREGTLDLVTRIALDAAESIEVRIQAVNKLGAHRHPSAAPPLRAILDRPDRREGAGGAGETERLKAAAERALFALALAADRDRMLKVLTTGPERTRRLALVALEQLRDPSTRGAVEAMVSNGLIEPDNRARGLRVLAAIGGRDVAEGLLKRLREETLPELRLGALEALALLDPKDFEERLLHYLRVLENSRHHDLTARDRFAEFLGELGHVASPAVIGFLVDFLLEGGAAQAATPGWARKDPLHVAARAALLGQDPSRVRAALTAALRARCEAGPGLGLPESFYMDLIGLLTHPTRQAAWSALALDLGARVLATPPAGSRHDARCLKFEADWTLESGDFARAARALERLHRLAVVEGHLEREDAQAAITDDPVARLRALAGIAGALLRGDEAPAVTAVADAVAIAPHDGPTLVAAIQAIARIGAGFEQAEACLRALGPRRHGRAAAAARYDLAVALLGAGRVAAGAEHLRVALRDHPALRETALEDRTVREALGEAGLAALLAAPTEK